MIPGVRPVELPRVGVDGERVGHPDVGVHDALQAVAGKPGPLDLGGLGVGIESSWFSKTQMTN